MLDPAFLDSVEHSFGFFGGAGQRFFTQNMLAGSGGGDTGFGVGIIGAAVVEKLHCIVGKHLLPVGVGSGVAEAQGGGTGCFCVAAADGCQHRDGWRRIHHVGNFFEGIAVGFAHKGVAQHADTDFWCLALRRRSGHRGKSCSFAHRTSPWLG